MIAIFIGTGVILSKSVLNLANKVIAAAKVAISKKRAHTGSYNNL